jgi:hypothetical protein
MDFIQKQISFIEQNLPKQHKLKSFIYKIIDRWTKEKNSFTLFTAEEV